MTNDTEIRPALTAEEWKFPRVIEYQRDWEIQMGLDQGDWPVPYRESGYAVWISAEPRGSTAHAAHNIQERRHALAALALHGQPFGFTRDDVEHVRLVAGQCDALRLGPSHASVLRDLADRIAALLPPEA